MSISLNDFTCPHCSKDNATLFDSAKFLRPISRDITLVFSCKTCDKSIVFDLEMNQYGQVLLDTRQNLCIVMSDEHLKDSNGNFLAKVVDYYPKHQPPSVPEHLSTTVHKNFLEAKELFLLKRYNASGMTSRRTIDLATKELLPDHTGQLNGRVKALLEKNIITQQLFKWAGIVRLGGNDANHEYEDFTKEEAQTLLDFAEMFLMYAFTLPKMVELKKASTGKPSCKNVLTKLTS